LGNADRRSKIRNGGKREQSPMTIEQFGSNIAELRAEHEYLVMLLNDVSTPSHKVEILERLQRVRERMRAVGTRHINELKAERARNRRAADKN
jgi:hypothetical protein